MYPVKYRFHANTNTHVAEGGSHAKGVILRLSPIMQALTKSCIFGRATNEILQKQLDSEAQKSRNSRKVQKAKNKSRVK